MHKKFNIRIMNNNNKNCKYNNDHIAFQLRHFVFKTSKFEAILFSNP